MQGQLLNTQLHKILKQLSGSFCLEDSQRKTFDTLTTRVITQHELLCCSTDTRVLDSHLKNNNNNEHDMYCNEN